jgi:hypothetical protein
MTTWLKIEDNIFEIIKSEHQFTIDNSWTSSFFSIDTKSNPTYFDIILNYYSNKKVFDWEDNKSKGFSASIKTMDIFDNILSFTVKSKEWGIKDKAYERNERLEQILPEEKTSDEK